MPESYWCKAHECYHPDFDSACKKEAPVTLKLTMYETEKLELAAFLISKGFKNTKTEWRGGKIAFFSFDESELLDEAKQDYLSNGNIAVHTYNSARAHLLSIVHSKKK